VTVGWGSDEQHGQPAARELQAQTARCVDVAMCHGLKVAATTVMVSVLRFLQCKRHEVTCKHMAPSSAVQNRHLSLLVMKFTDKAKPRTNGKALPAAAGPHCQLLPPGRL
jgi:hypothetical protein